MGVNIMMRPGTIMRSKGEPICITPGFRSKAAGQIERLFGSTPCEINRDDLYKLELLETGESLHLNEGGFWHSIRVAVETYDSVVIDLEY